MMPSESHQSPEIARQADENCCKPALEGQADNSCCAPDSTSQLADEAAKTAADLFKALADPARLQILAILSERAGEVCVCDLEGHVGLPDELTGQRPKQPTVSHHLKVLRDAGLVGCEKRGVWAYYFLRREQLAAAQDLLTMFASTPTGTEGHSDKSVQSFPALAVRGQG